MAVATRFNALGMPSFLTISVTNTLTYTYAVQAGDTAETLVNRFQAFLAAQTGLGMQVTRTSSTSLNILVTGTATAALSWQVTDTGRLGMATASDRDGDGHDQRPVDRPLDAPPEARSGARGGHKPPPCLFGAGAPAPVAGGVL